MTSWLLLWMACRTGPSAEDPGHTWSGEWLVEWERPSARPPLFRGHLDLRWQDGDWTGQLDYVDAHDGRMKTTAVQLEADRARLELTVDPTDAERAVRRSRRSAPHHVIELRRGDGDVLGTASWVDAGGELQIPPSPVLARRPWVDRLAGASALPFEAARPREVGLDPAKVDALVREAQLNHSSGLVLVHEGKLVVAVGERPEAPAMVASVTKAIASLAVPLLIAEGRWPSVDAPLAPALPEWTGDPRGTITLRHVLTHTTGLHTPAYREWIGRARANLRADLVGAALEVEPGTRFLDSNRTIELLSTVVSQTTGAPLSVYLQHRLAEPLGLDLRWSEAADQTLVHGGLYVDAGDLAVIGSMLASDGLWKDVRVLPEGWATQLATPAIDATPLHGLGWQLMTGGFFHTGDSGAVLAVFPETHTVLARVHLPNRPNASRRARQHGIGQLIPIVQGLRRPSEP